MTPIIQGSLRWGITAPATLLRSDSRLAVATEPENADHGSCHGKHEKQATEEFHGNVNAMTKISGFEPHVNEVAFIG
jgi:hypothetical protein